MLLKNSLLVEVTNGIAYTGRNVETESNGPNFFQVVGAGAHYLQTNSSYLGSGTTGIDPTLAAALKSRTVFPPTVLTNAITSTMILGPTVPRDTGVPALG